MPDSASLQGADKMRAKLRLFKKKFPDEVGRALYMETQVELKEVMRRTPVDRGNLRASEHVEGPLRKGLLGRIIYTRIVAGGPSAPYAIYVHEDLEASHVKNGIEIGQAKFIESVLRESAPFMAVRVGRRIELNRVLA